MNPVQRPAAPGNYAVGRNQRISRITFHHIVGDARAAIARFQMNSNVSATYVIGSDGTLYQCVSENDTPFTDGNYDSNSKSITIEHAGGIPSVPYTEAMYQTSIKLVRDLISRYAITDFKRHRDIVATACPGELDVERIISEAKGGSDDMTITDPNFRRIWSLSGFDVGPAGRQPTVKEVNEAVGREFNEFMDYWLNTDPVRERIRKGAYYDQDTANAGEFEEVLTPLFKKKGV